MIFYSRKYIYQLYWSKSAAIYGFVLLPEPRVVAVMAQVVGFDLLLTRRYSKSSGIFSQGGAGKVALSELALISLELWGVVCNGVIHQFHSVSKPAFGWSGVQVLASTAVLTLRIGCFCITGTKAELLIFSC